MSRRHAFTFAELLVAITITGLVMASVLSLAFSVFKSYELHQDLTEAKQRGQIAIAAIQPFVLNAGLGMPNTTTSFQKAFSGLTLLLPAPETAKFKGFVQLASGADAVSSAAATSDKAVWLVYSVPSRTGIANNRIIDIEELVQKEIPIVGTINTDHIVEGGATTNTLDAWVSFPSSLSPFRVAKINSSSLEIVSQTDQIIAAFDELHYVRAAKLFIDADSLKVDHLDGAGGQSLVDGIAGLWCTFDPNGDRVLTVRVLARSSMKRTQHQSLIEGWPDDASPVKADLDSSYRYAVVSRSWRIRN